MGRRALVGTAVAAAALVVAAVALASGSNRQVQMLDNCDGASFNAVIGPGTCVRSGGTTFDRFIDQLVTQGRAPAWRFASDRLSLPAGGTIEAVNRGGEFHTLTEVRRSAAGASPC